jgi:hypothetical protein
MKKELKITAAALCAACLALSGTAWAQSAVPDDILAGAKGIDSEEATAAYTFNDAKIEKWSADGGKNYIHTGSLWSKLQYEDGGDWQADLSKFVTFVDAGDGDTMIAFSMPMTVHYGWIQNYSEQAKTPKSVKNLVWKMKIYIPVEYSSKGKDSPALRFMVRDDQWNLKYLKFDDADSVLMSDIGPGWHVFTMDFAKKTYDFGTKKGTMKLPSVRKTNAVELQFNGKGIQDVHPIYVDWLSIDGLE